MRKSSKEIVVKFEWLQYLATFTATFLRAFHILSYEYTGSMLPYLYISKVVIVLLNYWLPLDMRNRTPEEQKAMEKDWRYTVPLYAYFFAELYFQIWLLNVVYYDAPQLSWYQWVMFMFTIQVATGGNLLVGHELGHRREWYHKLAAYIMYLRFMYTNFLIAHNQGHHKWVATPRDPASARKGETVYSFAVRSSYGQFWQSWNIERERVLTTYPKIDKISLFFRNRVLWCKAGEMLALFSIYQIWGFRVVIYFLVFALFVQFGLEVINYVEHYGLRRKEIAPGVYDKISIRHSWNAAHRMSNLLFFKLERHSDHHENGYKPYQTLCSYEESPQLPHGYGLSFLIALQPKKWFALMDPLVQAYQEENRSLTAEEVENCKNVSRQVIYKEVVKVHIYCLLGLFL